MGVLLVMPPVSLVFVSGGVEVTGEVTYGDHAVGVAGTPPSIRHAPNSSNPRIMSHAGARYLPLLLTEREREGEEAVENHPR